jgi:hypothetical protein
MRRRSGRAIQALLDNAVVERVLWTSNTDAARDCCTVDERMLWTWNTDVARDCCR